MLVVSCSYYYCFLCVVGLIAGGYVAGFMLMLLLFSVCLGLIAGGCVGGFMLILLLFLGLIAGGCVGGFMLIVLLFSVCFRVDCRWLCGWFHADTITVFV